MLEALSIAIDLCSIVLQIRVLVHLEKRRWKHFKEYKAKEAQPLAMCMQKFSKLFAVTHSTSNQPGGGQISLACVSSIKDVFVSTFVCIHCNWLRV